MNKRQKKKFKKKLYHKKYVYNIELRYYETVLYTANKVSRNGNVIPLSIFNRDAIENSLSNIASLRPETLTELEIGRPWWCGGIVDTHNKLEVW